MLISGTREQHGVGGPVVQTFRMDLPDFRLWQGAQPLTATPSNGGRRSRARRVSITSPRPSRNDHICWLRAGGGWPCAAASATRCAGRRQSRPSRFHDRRSQCDQSGKTGLNAELCRITGENTGDESVGERFRDFLPVRRRTKASIDSSAVSYRRGRTRSKSRLILPAGSASCSEKGPEAGRQLGS